MSSYYTPNDLMQDVSDDLTNSYSRMEQWNTHEIQIIFLGLSQQIDHINSTICVHSCCNC